MGMSLVNCNLLPGEDVTLKESDTHCATQKQILLKEVFQEHSLHDPPNLLMKVTHALDGVECYLEFAWGWVQPSKMCAPKST